MALTFNGGTNVIGGLAVGGLPDGTVDEDTLADSITLGGISNYDEWWNTTTTSVSSGTNVMSAGWTRKAGVSAIGDAMTESSGVFTFPSTGIWLYEFHALYAGNINTHMGLNVQHSTDSGSNWSYNAVNESHVYVSNETTIVYTFVSQQSSFDVTNASTARIRFNTSSSTTSGSIYGNANYDQVGARFTRLGDT